MRSKWPARRAIHKKNPHPCGRARAVGNVDLSEAIGNSCVHHPRIQSVFGLKGDRVACAECRCGVDEIAILPSLYALSEAIRDPNFKVRRIDHPQAIHPVFLYWRRSAKNQHLMETLREEMMTIKARIREERARCFKVGLTYQ